MGKSGHLCCVFSIPITGVRPPFHATAPPKLSMLFSDFPLFIIHKPMKNHQEWVKTSPIYRELPSPHAWHPPSSAAVAGFHGRWPKKRNGGAPSSPMLMV